MEKVEKWKRLESRKCQQKRCQIEDDIPGVNALTLPLKSGAAKEIGWDEQGRQQKIVDAKFMKGTAERGNYGKAIAVHHVGIQIIATNESSNSETQHRERN